MEEIEGNEGGGNKKDFCKGEEGLKGKSKTTKRRIKSLRRKSNKRAFSIAMDF